MLFRPWICACCLVTLLAHAQFPSFPPDLSLLLPHLSPPAPTKLVVKQTRVSDSQNGSVRWGGMIRGGAWFHFENPCSIEGGGYRGSYVLGWANTKQWGWIAVDL